MYVLVRHQSAETVGHVNALAEPLRASLHGHAQSG